MHAPLSVLPAPFPEASFHKAVSAAAPFNTLIAAVAADSAYLQETLAPAAEFDDFTVRSLWSSVCHLSLLPHLVQMTYSCESSSLPTHRLQGLQGLPNCT